MSDGSLSTEAVREVVKDVVGLNERAVAGVDDVLEEAFSGMDELAAILERIVETRQELEETTVARMMQLSGCVQAAFAAIEGAEAAVGAVGRALDGYQARLDQLQGCWNERMAATAPTASAKAGFGLFGFSKGGVAAEPEMIVFAPPPHWDAAEIRLNEGVHADRLAKAVGLVDQCFKLAESPLVEEDAPASDE
jgi:hypothetical protein